MSDNELTLSLLSSDYLQTPNELSVKIKKKYIDNNDKLYGKEADELELYNIGFNKKYKNYNEFINFVLEDIE